MCLVMSMICWCHHLTTFEVAKLLIKAFIAFFRIRLLVSNLPANPACFPALIRLLCWFLMISVLSWRPLTPPQSCSMFCCFNSTQFQEFDFLQPATATTSSVATTSHAQLQTAHWTVAGQMLWHGVHTGSLVFLVCFPIFVGMSAGARKTALNTTRSWQQHFVGQATQTWQCSLDAVRRTSKNDVFVTDSRMQYSR